MHVRFFHVVIAVAFHFHCWSAVFPCMARTNSFTRSTIDVWVFNLWLLQIMLLYILLCMSFPAHVLVFLLGIYLRVELLHQFSQLLSVGLHTTSSDENSYFSTLQADKYSL